VIRRPKPLDAINPSPSRKNKSQPTYSFAPSQTAASEINLPQSAKHLPPQHANPHREKPSPAHTMHKPTAQNHHADVSTSHPNVFLSLPQTVTERSTTPRTQRADPPQCSRASRQIPYRHALPFHPNVFPSLPQTLEERHHPIRRYSAQIMQSETTSRKQSSQTELKPSKYTKK
jgi:hypothetical protein